MTRRDEDAATISSPAPGGVGVLILDMINDFAFPGGEALPKGVALGQGILLSSVLAERPSRQAVQSAAADAQEQLGPPWTGSDGPKTARFRGPRRAARRRAG
jgi:hypothetical protein